MKFENFPKWKPHCQKRCFPSPARLNPCSQIPIRLGGTMVDVVSKFLIIRPLPLSLPFFTQFPPFSKSHFPRLFSLSATKSLNPQPYGPTLHKLTIAKLPFLSKDGPGNDDHEFDPDDFTRVFDVSALRVPSKDCFSLENRLRGHLLNWPRIRNIARVPGDEIEEEFKSMLPPEIEGEQEEEEGSLSLDRLNRRIYGKAESDGERLSPVLHREELVKTFNSKGYVNFRNLAKMSRPKKKKVKFGTEKNERIGKSNFSVVEVVEEIGDDFSRLLGDEFKGGSKWRGSTRLFLLDEAYASTHVEELPEAVKAAIHDYNGQSSTPTIELVRCKLTLFYGYWPMNEILESVLPDGMIVPSAFETVGHIAHLNLRDEHSPYKKLIAKVVLDKNSPKIQTVVNKVDAIDNDYRTMQLEVLAGNHSLVTTVMENGLRFQLDLATVYWNSRLATERQTLLNGFTRDDILCDVFSGVGPIALAAAKKVKRVYANDLNPQAVDYLERNSMINKLERKIKVFNMDGRRFINAMFTSEKGHSITQVVMNLPMDAAEYLDAFRGIFRNEPKGMEFSLPRIHVYGFSKAEDPEFDFQERIRIAMSEVGFEVKMRKVRLVAPGKWMLCASFILPRSVAFGKPVLDM